MDENILKTLKNKHTDVVSEASNISKKYGSTITVGFYSKINCNILKSGINPLFDQYYLCECDPERRNAICFECFKMCHTGPRHKEIKKFYIKFLINKTKVKIKKIKNGIFIASNNKKQQYKFNNGNK